jgi:hypothetical protein
MLIKVAVNQQELIFKNEKCVFDLFKNQNSFIFAQNFV